LLKSLSAGSRSTFQVNGSAWSRGLVVTGGGAGVVSHAGTILLRQLADGTGLTAGFRRRWPRAVCWFMTAGG
jgi:hypothetical protein